MTVLSSTCGALQRTNTENSRQIFPEKNLHGHSHNFHIHVSVSDLYVPTIELPILLQELCGPILGIYKSPNVEIRTEAEQFPEKLYINGIFLAVHSNAAYRTTTCTRVKEKGNNFVI
jgi:hypothetical protein